MNDSDKTPLLGMNADELQTVCASLGMPSYTSRQIAGWIYARGVAAISELTNVTMRHREMLAGRYCVGHLPYAERMCSVDGTVKYLFPTRDGHYVESVFIPDGERATLCVSSQVGCRMGCRFCMTGRQGFQGQLTAADILNQIYSLPERDRLTNVGFMGQGEPMDNLEPVLRATQLLTAPYGWGWSPKRITVSTVGVKKRVDELLDRSDCHLAVSLHNPFPEERKAMMPAEGGYGLTDLLSLLRRYDWTHQRRLSFEYIVFDGLNDTDAHARQLVRLLSQMECRVNLIRFHDIPDSPYRGASEQRMMALRDYLTRHGVTTTIRASRGQDIYAACGLLSTAGKEGLPCVQL